MRSIQPFLFAIFALGITFVILHILKRLLGVEKRDPNAASSFAQEFVQFGPVFTETHLVQAKLQGSNFSHWGRFDISEIRNGEIASRPAYLLHGKYDYQSKYLMLVVDLPKAGTHVYLSMDPPEDSKWAKVNELQSLSEERLAVWAPEAFHSKLSAYLATISEELVQFTDAGMELEVIRETLIVTYYLNDIQNFRSQHDIPRMKRLAEIGLKSQVL
jgi:hypothetical protein